MARPNRSNPLVYLARPAGFEPTTPWFVVQVLALCVLIVCFMQSVAERSDSMHVAQRSGLLRPPLFARAGFLRWQGHGLTASSRVADADRGAACPSVGETFADIDEFLRRFDSREPTRIEINPRRFPLSRLRDWLTEAKRFSTAAEEISVDYGLPMRSYDYRISDEMIDGERTLGQHLTLVAFDRRTPVGYAGMTYSITDTHMHSHARLRIELRLV